MFHSKRNTIYRKYPTGAQKWLLIELLKINLPLARNEIPNIENRIVRRFIMWEEWEDISKRLNSLGGAHKTGKEWKQFWDNLKSCTKAKISYQANIKLNNLEKSVISILTDDNMIVNGKFDTIHDNVQCALIYDNANGDGKTDGKNFESIPLPKSFDELESEYNYTKDQLEDDSGVMVDFLTDDDLDNPPHKIHVQCALINDNVNGDGKTDGKSFVHIPKLKYLDKFESEENYNEHQLKYDSELRLNILTDDDYVNTPDNVNIQYSLINDNANGDRKTKKKNFECIPKLTYFDQFEPEHNYTEGQLKYDSELRFNILTDDDVVNDKVKCVDVNGDRKTDGKNFEKVSDQGKKLSVENERKQFKIETYQNFNSFSDCDSPITKLDQDLSKNLQYKSIKSQSKNKSSKHNSSSETFENTKKDVHIENEKTDIQREPKETKIELKKEKLQIKREKLQLLMNNSSKTNSSNKTFEIEIKDIQREPKETKIDLRKEKLQSKREKLQLAKNQSSKNKSSNDTFENERKAIQREPKETKINLKKEKLQIKREKLQILKEAIDIKKRVLTLLETSTNNEIISSVAKDEIKIKISINM